MKPVVALTDEERFPLIRDWMLLNSIRQDAHAPHFNFESGDRLTEHHLKLVTTYANSIRRQGPFLEKGKLPGWLQPFTQTCISTVPFYKDRTKAFLNQPTISRRDLAASPWMFVSSEAALQELLVYQTSGTTGPPMDVLFDPVSQACWLPQLQSILDRHGIELSHHGNKVALALICAQLETLTYASLSTYLKGAGILKINLHASQWKRKEDAVVFLEKYDPEILTGDPFAFTALMETGAKLHPKAMVSSAMALTMGLQKKLEARFGCRVFDVYSLTECRMVAVAEKGRHRAIRPDLYLEVFDEHEDRLLPEGERGELVITGGNNPFLPLVRYRTGDFCSIRIENGIPYLYDLEARRPVAFYKTEKMPVNAIDLTRALSTLPLVACTVHQNRDFSIQVRVWSSDGSVGEKIDAIIQDIFSNAGSVRVTILDMIEVPTTKPVSFSSDFDAGFID